MEEMTPELLKEKEERKTKILQVSREKGKRRERRGEEEKEKDF